MQASLNNLAFFLHQLLDPSTSKAAAGLAVDNGLVSVTILDSGSPNTESDAENQVMPGTWTHIGVTYNNTDGLTFIDF